MAKDRSLVRAGDLGQWAFCHRAWWLAHVQKAEHGNPEALKQGTRHHDAHGRRVLGAQRLQQAALLLLVGACVIALVLLIQLLV